MSAKGRITYRFDKQSGDRIELSNQETERASTSNTVSYFQEELTFTSDGGTWNSPFQNDAYALEHLIREADGQFSYKQPKARMSEGIAQAELLADEQQYVAGPMEAGEAILLGDEGVGMNAPLDTNSKHRAAPQIIDMYPQIEGEGLYPRKDGMKAAHGSFPQGSGRRPGSGPSWFKVFVSISAAIGTGALFGYFVLMLFTSGTASQESTKIDVGAVKATGGSVSSQSGSSLSSKGDDVKPTGAGNVGGNQTVETGVNGASDGASTNALKIHIPSTTYYMLQYGVFSSKEGLSAAEAELRGKGLAAATLTSKSDYRIYAGMATDRNGAALLGQTLTGLDVYIKPIAIPELTSIQYAGKAGDTEAFFEYTSALLDKLNGRTVAKLSGQKDDAGTDWQKLHQRWTEAVTRLNKGLTDNASKEALQKLVQAVNTAAVAFGEYEKKPSDAYLWTVQTALMNAVFIQKDWFESMESL